MPRASTGDNKNRRTVSDLQFHLSPIGVSAADSGQAADTSSARHTAFRSVVLARTISR